MRVFIILAVALCGSVQAQAPATLDERLSMRGPAC